jgi:hypothetical protein
MAEPVSRAAWSRLVALLNAYVADKRNLYGVDGGFRDGFIWRDEISGMSNLEDWNLPKLVTRSLARTAFNEMFRNLSVCKCPIWAVCFCSYLNMPNVDR